MMHSHLRHSSGLFEFIIGALKRQTAKARQEENGCCTYHDFIDEFALSQGGQVWSIESARYLPPCNGCQALYAIEVSVFYGHHSGLCKYLYGRGEGEGRGVSEGGTRRGRRSDKGGERLVEREEKGGECKQKVGVGCTCSGKL
jgi:hypothetical protein